MYNVLNILQRKRQFVRLFKIYSYKKIRITIVVLTIQQSWADASASRLSCPRLVFRVRVASFVSFAHPT